MANFSLLARFGSDTTGLENGIKKSEVKVKKFGSSLRKLRGDMASSFGNIAATFFGAALIKNITSLGLAAGETASKFKAVFGPAADAMNAKVQELRKTIPSTTAEMQNALATFANMATAMGLPTDAANQFSVEMVKLAGDMASFHNLRIEDAFAKIQSAISGEFEPMKALGIVINEAKIKQEGLNLGINEGTKQLSAAQKALIVQAILIKDMGIAHGDAALTANSAANQVKFLQAKLKEAGTEIGTTILPAVASLTKAFSSIINGAKGASEAVGTFLAKQIYGDPERIEAEGDLALQGITKGRGRGGAKKYEDQIKAQIEANRKKREEEKKAAEEKRKADDEAIKNSGDVQTELSKQIAVEKDPARKKAMEDSLAAYGEILKKVGDLNDLTPPALGGKGGKEPTKQEELKKKLAQIEMARIRAQASGDAAAEASLARRLEMAKEVLRLMDAGFSQDEATRLANKLSQPEDKRGDFVSSLTGDDLKRAANEAAEKGTRFQRMADGTFQKYVNGSRKGNFTEAQLQAGLEKRIEKDPTDKTLKDIKNILQGKFVNE